MDELCAGCQAASGDGRGGPDDDARKVAATSDPVKTARSNTTCPSCRSRGVARIQYGEPAYSEGLEADLEAHRVVLGGCVVWDDQHDRSCRACGLEFRAEGVAPVLDPTP